VSVLNQTGLSLRNKLIMINNNKKPYIKVRTCPTRDCMRQKIFQNYYKAPYTHDSACTEQTKTETEQ
jgi:hypothetical protein